jgi:hypothetical protein
MICLFRDTDHTLYCSFSKVRLHLQHVEDETLCHTSDINSLRKPRDQASAAASTGLSMAPALPLVAFTRASRVGLSVRRSLASAHTACEQEELHKDLNNLQ